MGFKRASLRSLLVAVVIQAMAVRCQNTTVATSNPGKEITNRPFLETRATTQVSEEEKVEATPTAAASEEDKPTIELQMTTRISASLTAEEKTKHKMAASSSVAVLNKEIVTKMMPYPFDTHAKELLTSSESMTIFGANSKDLNQVIKTETAQITASKSKPLQLVFASVTASEKEVWRSDSLKPEIASQIVAWRPVDSSSSSIGAFVSSSGSVLRHEAKIASLDSRTKAMMTSPISVTTSVIVPATIPYEEKTSTYLVATETSQQIVPSSSSKRVLPLSSEDHRMSSPTEVLSPPRGSPEETKGSGMMFTPTTSASATSQSFHAVSTFDEVKSKVVEHLSKHAKIIATLQPTKATLTSPYLTPSLQISRSVSSFKTLRSSPNVAGLPFLITTAIKAVKSTLMLSSSHLADEMTSSASVATSSTEMSLTPTKMTVATTEAVMTSSPNSPSNAVVTSTANTEVKRTSSESPSHQPTHTKEHEKPHPIDTHSNDTDAPSNVTSHGGERPTMGSPQEPDVEETYTDQQQGVDDNWIVSVIVVFALLGGMLVFVGVFIIKDRARIRKRNLGDKKRPGGDHGFVPLKEVKTDEEPAKLTKVEKRSSHYGNPEDAVPLLELHIADDGRSVLNSHDETQDTQVEPNGNATTTKRPLLDLYGDHAKRSQETLNSPRFI